MGGLSSLAQTLSPAYALYKGLRGTKNNQQGAQPAQPMPFSSGHTLDQATIIPPVNAPVSDGVKRRQQVTSGFMDQGGTYG